MKTKRVHWTMATVLTAALATAGAFAQSSAPSSAPASDDQAINDASQMPDPDTSPAVAPVGNGVPTWIEQKSASSRTQLQELQSSLSLSQDKIDKLKAEIEAMKGDRDKQNAALIAAGLAGIDEKLELQKPFVGDAYQAARLPEIPKTLRDATEAFSKSKMLKAALGEEVVEHYVHNARWEQMEYDRRITDWELHRGFERY